MQWNRPGLLMFEIKEQERVPLLSCRSRAFFSSSLRKRPGRYHHSREGRGLVELRWGLILGLLLCLTACSSTRDNFLEEFELPILGERSESSELLMPPGFVAPQTENTFDIPGSERSLRQEAMNSPVLPARNGLKLHREGNVAWLSVGLKPVEAWDYLKRFITAYGFSIVNENPVAGSFETNWLEHKIHNSETTVPVRDRFRIRMEREANAFTNIYVANHKSVYQKGAWQLAVSDIETELSILQNMQIYFSQLQQQVEEGKKVLEIQNQTITVDIEDVAGVPVLRVGGNYSDVWRRLGLALDRSGLRISSTDRSRGIFRVEYAPRRRGTYAEQVELHLLPRQGETMITAHVGNDRQQPLSYDSAYAILKQIVWVY